ncbi:uncharacterized protein LOC122320732 [Drosophila ficusphila]|uniref:uncharacterized protein LOC122320732 n=1 Tax=Drosophila ficusphila TaxID=30025 RepID=UPI001C89F856|nr:uncharacterized protein LOC122320732 [Drosophila ficusphila]
MQLSILFLLLGWVAVAHSFGLGQLFLISSRKPSSNENNDQSASKGSTQHFKRCKPVESRTITQYETTTRRLVPLPTLAPSSMSSSEEPNSIDYYDDIPFFNGRRLVPLPTLKPTSESLISREDDITSRQRRGILVLPSSIIESALGTAGILREQFHENVAYPIRKLVHMPTVEPFSLPGTDQNGDDC